MDIPEFDKYPYGYMVLAIGGSVSCWADDVDDAIVRGVLLDKIRDNAALWQMRSMPVFETRKVDKSQSKKLLWMSYKYYASEKLDTGEGINGHVGIAVDLFFDFRKIKI